MHKSIYHIKPLSSALFRLLKNFPHVQPVLQHQKKKTKKKIVPLGSPPCPACAPAPKILKTQLVLALYSKYTRALNFQNFFLPVLQRQDLILCYNQRPGFNSVPRALALKS